jgi:hypothetical protein
MKRTCNAPHIAATLAAVNAPQTESASTGIPLSDLTLRSANEFKFGLLAGKRIVLILPDSISSRNVPQNFVSRSCNR